MDQKLIYRKTTLGDEAIQSRARLSEHELRVILILVDGKKTVADIVAKIGDLTAVERALYRLEQQGMIQPAAGFVSDIELERSDRQLRELFSRKPVAIEVPPVPVMDSSALFKPAGLDQQPVPMATVIDIPPIPSDSEVVSGKSAGFVPEPSASAPASAAPVPQAAPIAVAPTPAAPKAAAPGPASTPASSSTATRTEPVLSSWDEEDDERRPGELPPRADPGDAKKGREGPAADARTSPMAAAAAVRNPFSVGGPATPAGFERARDEVDAESRRDTAKKPREPIAFPFPRRRKNLGKLVLWVLGACLAVPPMAFLVYPFDSLRAELEASLGAAMRQPVAITRVRASLSPMPVFHIDELKLGAAGDLVVREVQAEPDLLTLFSQRKRFNDVRLRGVRVPVERLGTLSTALGGVGASPAIGVRRIVISQLTLVARDLQISDYAGRAEMDDSGRLRTLSLLNGDGTLTLSVVGDDSGGALLLAEGAGWKPSPGSPFVFENIQIAGSLKGSEFVTDRIEGRLFRGAVRGSLRFSWAGGMQVETDIASEYMSAQVLMTALGVPAIVEGELDGRVRFAVSAESWDKLLASVPMAGDFIARKGSLRNMDLVEAVRRAGKQPYRGGATKFDEMQGSFVWDGRDLRLSAIDLASTHVGASGAVRVGKDQRVDGLLSVVVKSSAARTREPVHLGGTLKDPELLAGR